jgi:hypothetical protein
VVGLIQPGVKAIGSKLDANCARMVASGTKSAQLLGISSAGAAGDSLAVAEGAGDTTLGVGLSSGDGAGAGTQPASANSSASGAIIVRITMF